MIRVGGVVLCGGQSKRMGRPKAWLPIAGEIMLPRIVRLLSEVVSPVVVVAAREQELPPLPPAVRIVFDEVEARGPLQGLAAGLAALKEVADAAYVSSCDVPFLRPSFIRRMIELLGDQQICVPYVDGYHHPLAAVYRVETLPLIWKLLPEDRLRPVYLFESAMTRVVGPDELRDIDPEFESLRNVNTPEEYELADCELRNRKDDASAKPQAAE